MWIPLGVPGEKSSRGLTRDSQRNPYILGASRGHLCDSWAFLSSICTRFRDITVFCSSTPLFATPPLVSPKFPHVPLGVGGWRLGYEERRFWANCSGSYFSKISNLCGPNPPTSQTDRQTDGRTDGQTDRQATCDRNTALCIIVHRAVKIISLPNSLRLLLGLTPTW